jgi:hypothetical protein
MPPPELLAPQGVHAPGAQIDVAEAIAISRVKRLVQMRACRQKMPAHRSIPVRIQDRHAPTLTCTTQPLDVACPQIVPKSECFAPHPRNEISDEFDPINPPKTATRTVFSMCNSIDISPALTTCFGQIEFLTQSCSETPRKNNYLDFPLTEVIRVDCTENKYQRTHTIKAMGNFADA